MYYNDNEIDTTSKEEFANTIITKVVQQEINSDVYQSPLGVFTQGPLDVGAQVEEIEIGNINPTDFDKTGKKALEKADMNIKALYHKKNSDKTFKATVSDKQIKYAMLSRENLAKVGTAITNELENSANIAEYEQMKQLIKDVADKKKFVLCDMNDLSNNMDNLIKAIQVVSDNMTFPSTEYNFLGFKKEFCRKEDLYLIISTDLKARLNVDSLASAFNIDKKSLVGNILVVDNLPEISYTAEESKKGVELTIGDGATITTYKPQSSGEATATGKAICLLCHRKALIRKPVDRSVEPQRNAEGRFTNYFLHKEDLLSYSPFRNAVLFID